MKILFWLSVLAIFYTYFGYPLLLTFFAKVKKGKPVDKKPFFPQISIVIPAYNEENNIGAKLNDILNLDYPKEMMEVVVVSDFSSDDTDNIIRQFSEQGVRLYRLKKRSGKIAAYRNVLPHLKGEIIVFSDATSLLNSASVANLVSNFHDQSVGCAAGLLMYINPKQAIVGKGEKKYWKYGEGIREYEYKLDSLPSVSGTFYAVRRNLYPVHMKDDLADDLMVPLYVRKKGFRTVFEKEAICRDYTTVSIREEMAKRIRITVQNIRGLIEQIDILNPFKYGWFSFIVISHKLFRLLVPLFLAAAFITTLFLSFHSSFFRFIFVAQIFFYIGAKLGYLINQKAKFSLGNALFYFCLSNWAILKGIVGFLKGKKIVTWETARA